MTGLPAPDPSTRADAGLPAPSWQSIARRIGEARDAQWRATVLAYGTIAAAGIALAVLLIADAWDESARWALWITAALGLLALYLAGRNGRIVERLTPTSTAAALEEAVASARAVVDDEDEVVQIAYYLAEYVGATYIDARAALDAGLAEETGS